ncbi:MAG: nuclear transport factor 2 family protein [Solirubrobacterales bacterium]
MSQENVEVVRGIIDAINRGDIDAVVESATEDFVTDWSNSRGLLSGIHRGRDQVREAFESFLEPWDSLRWEPEELIELDEDRVLTVSRLQMRGRGSGVEVNASGASIWTIRDRRAAAITLYQSKAEALEAAAVRE